MRLNKFKKHNAARNAHSLSAVAIWQNGNGTFVTGTPTRHAARVTWGGEGGGGFYGDFVRCGAS